MIDTTEASDIGTPSLFAQFYGIQVTDDDMIAVAEQLESVCPGLGNWFMDIDVEFQRDLMAAGYLFWESRKAPCKCAAKGKANVAFPKPARPRPLPPPNGRRPTLLQSFRERRGLSQGKLAKLVGTTQPTIHRWEPGELSHRARVSPHVQANLESLFGKSLAELLIPIDQPNSNPTITQAEGI